MKENCPICGLEVCETSECAEILSKEEVIEGELITLQEDLTPEIVENVTDPIVEAKNTIVGYITDTSKPIISKLSELVLETDEDYLPVLSAELNYLAEKTTYPQWLDGYINLLTSGAESQRTAAKILNVNQSTISNFFRLNDIRNIHAVLMDYNKKATLAELEEELVTRIRAGRSDNLLMFALKKNDPSYRDNAQVTVNNNVLTQWNIEVE